VEPEMDTKTMKTNVKTDFDGNRYGPNTAHTQNKSGWLPESGNHSNYVEKPKQLK
jgi:hypothetical protein